MPQEWSEDIVVSRLSDEPALSDELSAALSQVEGGRRPPHMVLDFSGVSYLNSSNLAQLLSLRKKLGEHGRQLKLAGLQDEVWSIMLVTGLDKIFRFAPDTMTALAGLQIEAGADAGAEGDDTGEA